MRQITLLVLFVCLIVGASSSQVDNHASVLILPTPQQVLLKNTHCSIVSTTMILLGANSAGERMAAQQINDELRKWGKSQLHVEGAGSIDRLPESFIFVGSPASEIGRKLLTERKGTLTAEMKDEGYFLDVDSTGIVVIAESEKGKFYGAMSLVQMMRQEQGVVVVDGATIHDFPLHRMRGISDDISRGQVSTVENFKKIIRFLARYKMNTYSPYIEDMFAFQSHPLIGKGRGALTSAELKELDTYAKQYYVDIIPIFQTLGHCENLLSIPEYLHYAEYPGGRTLNISDEGTYTLLDELIGELCSSFSAPYFNMAADETRDVGLGASKERVAKLGLPKVLAEHYRRVAGIIKKHGKTPMIYGDIILKNPEILDMIPKDILIVDWNYDPQYHYDSPQVFKTAGFPFVVSPAVRNYRGPFLDYFNSFENIERFSRAGYDTGSNGLLISSWNDYGGEELRELNYYGYAWGAECAWQPLKSNVTSFNRAFFRDFFGANDTEPIQSAYAFLSSPANNYTWYELWRNPMLPFMPATPQKGHSPVIMERLQSIESTMPLVLSLIKRSVSSIQRNTDHLEYLAFVARLNLWFAKKVQVQEKVQELSRWALISPQRDSVSSAIISLCTDVLNDLAPLRRDFEALWMKTNKPEGLEYLLMRYDRQKAFWQEKIDQVKRGEFWIDPEIESSWIYHADIKSAQKEATRIQHAYFRKTFSVSKEIRSATLQLIGDTYVKVSVNGHPVGAVFVRRSNSLSAEHERIKVFDVSPFLTRNKNVITAEAQDFSVAGSAGLNIYCELRLSDGSIQKIKSDTTWKVAAAAGPGWDAVSFGDSRWNHVIVKPYPYTVVRPDFATGRLSWIEQ